MTLYYFKIYTKNETIYARFKAHEGTCESDDFIPNISRSRYLKLFSLNGNPLYIKESEIMAFEISTVPFPMLETNC